MDHTAAVERLVQQCVESPGFELEARIGRWHNRGGLNVTEEELNRLDAMLRASAHLQSTSWEESHCYFYPHKGRALRTETLFTSHDMLMKTETLCKQRQSVLDVPAHADLQCRFSLSTETRHNDVPEVVLPEQTRIRQRSSHTHVGRACTVRYDLSRTWSGTSKTDAEAHQKTSPARCELEVELVACHADAAKVARSFVAKVEDISLQLHRLA